MINLDNNTITLKKSVNQQKEPSSASVPLIGTFIPQDKNFKAGGNAPSSEASLKSFAEYFYSRSPKNKEVALSQSFLILVLTAESQSATIYNKANGNFRSVIQKPLLSLAQVSQKEVWHQGDLSDAPAKIDYRMEFTKGFHRYQEAPPVIVMPKFHDVAKKSIYPQTPGRLLQEVKSTT